MTLVRIETYNLQYNKKSQNIFFMEIARNSHLSALKKVAI